MAELNLEKLRELAGPYGITVEQVEPGEGGIYVNGQKLTHEEVMKIVLDENIEN